MTRSNVLRRGVRLPRPIPLAALLVTVAAMVVPLAIGSGSGRAVAVVTLGSMGLGVRLGTRRRRLEHAEDARPPSTGGLILEYLDSAGVIVLGLAVYAVIVVLATYGPASGTWQQGWTGALVAALASLTIVVPLLLAARDIARGDGIERRVAVDSAALAFVATILALAVYGLFETFVDAPRITAWAGFLFASGVWIVAGVVLHRRAA